MSMNDDDHEIKDLHKEQEMQDEVTLVNPIDSECLEDDTDHADVELTAREITTPSSHQVPV